jgi:hypothetical protein
MYWHFRKLTYDILIPKLDKSIYKLTKKEAAAYFEWFMDQVPERVAYVSQVCAKELHISVKRMDCSPKSLVLLWKWFRKRAETEPVILTEEEKKQPGYADGMFRNERQLTLETEYILRDIGMYLGETFRKNHPQIYWTYYTEPKRDFFANHPLLKGFIDMTTGVPFYAEFEPIHMAGVQASKILSKKSEDTDLLHIYTIWSQKM